MGLMPTLAIAFHKRRHRQSKLIDGAKIDCSVDKNN